MSNRSSVRNHFKKERKSKDTSKNSPNESGKDNQNGIVKENNYNLDKCNYNEKIPHVEVKDIKIIRNNEIRSAKMAETKFDKEILNQNNENNQNENIELNDIKNNNKYDLGKDTIDLNPHNSSKIIDNFRDESPNLSAIINMDEDDNGSIEMDRKRLSKLSKKDIDK